MNYGCSNVSFAGRVDKSVYEWADIARREAQKAEVERANYAGKEVTKEELKAIKTRTDEMMQVLEQKAALMHRDTVITVDKPLKAYRDRYLCVHNDKLEHHLRQTPWSNTENDWCDRLDRWKVAGKNSDKYTKGSYGGYDGPSGGQLLDLLEFRINDINPKGTDKNLFNMAVEYAIECSKSGSSKSLTKQVKNILSVQDDMGYKADFIGSVNVNRKKTDKARALRAKNDNLLENIDNGSGNGFFSKLVSFFK